PRLFKRYQIQPVWRADRPARGRFREFYQCDVDSLGSTSPAVEAELCAAVNDALEALGFADFRIRINHRVRLSALLRVFGIADELHSAGLGGLDKLDKIGGGGVAVELRERGIQQGSVTRFLALHGLVSQMPTSVGVRGCLDVLDAEERWLKDTL